MSRDRERRSPPAAAVPSPGGTDGGPWLRSIEARLREGPGLPSAPAVDGELLVGDRYVVLERIATEEDRFLLEVMDRDLGRTAWMHVLRAERARSPRHAEAFHAECRALASLDHPAFPPVYDAGIHPGGELFYSHRPPSGRTAAALAHDEGARIGRVELLLALATAARAVDLAGEAGLAHPRLGAAHVCIGDDGEVHLWGFSRAEAPRDDGEPWPETLGLGAVLYHLLAGVPPDDPPVPPRERAPERGVPVDLQVLCLRCLGLAQPAIGRPRALARALLALIEGDGRRDEAERRVLVARQALERYEALRDEEREVREAARSLGARGGGPVLPGAASRRGELESRLVVTRAAAERAACEAEDELFEALERDPQCAPALSSLSDLYFHRFREAEDARDPRGMALWAAATRRMGRGRHDARLLAPGALEVRCAAEGAVAQVCRFEPRGRRLVLGSAHDLGPVPVAGVGLLPGSYLLLLRAPGFAPAAVPLCVRRGEPVTLDVRLLPAGEVDPELVYVPAGPSDLGGDPDRPGDDPPLPTPVPGFLLGRLPVTCGQYARYVEDLARHDRGDALYRLPRDPGSGAPLWDLDPRGRVVFPDPASSPFPWRAELPVVGITREEARAFVAWLAGRTGRPLRLATSQEWEKAGRGADGRIHPWGNPFDVSFCRMRWTAPRAAPAPVGAHPEDCSPYGVRDLAGSVMEWCEGWVDPDRGLAPVRGGSWASDAAGCRLTRVVAEVPARRFLTVGFRIAQDLPPG
ncbi:SUMF1/EgtB/PvdO family nonheme iron enzyme [Myxococcota bacterium]|nr:SUMF1/EgtB/PvdO family nonheme iron enzyme [Myxococcota bacterium]